MNKNLIIGILTLAIAGLAYFLFQKPDPEVVHIRVPINIETKIPESKIVFEPVISPTPVLVKPRPIPEFEGASDKEKDSLYRDAITERTYNEIFDDSLATVTVHSKVEGRLKRQSVSTVLKERTVQIDTTLDLTVPVEKNIKVYAGAEISTWQDGVVPSLGLMLQNKKDRILKLSIDTEKNISAGIYFKL